MTKLENRFFDLIRKHIFTFTFVIITAFGIALHFCGLSLQSGDFKYFLGPWWDIIKSSGIGALSKQVGNYNIPYQIIIYIMTLFPWDSLIAYKSLSIVFDFVLAFGVMLLIAEITKSKAAALIGYSVTICSVITVFNSSFWGQCDSIYVSFIIFAIYFIFKDKTTLSFVFLGISFAFKLQVVFILPVFVFYYVLNRKVSILHFLIIPAVNFIMCLPAAFFGRSIIDILTVYTAQLEDIKMIQLNCPNIYALMCDPNNVANYDLLKPYSILITMLVLGSMLCLFIYKKVDISGRKNFLMTAIWTAFSCIMFLCSMHERYGYLLDMLLLVYVICYRKHIITAILCYLVSFRGYCSYLFQYNVVENKHAAILYVGIYIYITYVLINEVVLGNNSKLELKLKS